MDDTAREFHTVIFEDLSAKNDTGLPTAVLATLITDINRIARALEQIAHSHTALARVHGSQT